MAYTVSVASGCSGATLGLLGIVLGSLVLRFQESSDDSSHIFVFFLYLTRAHVWFDERFSRRSVRSSYCEMHPCKNPTHLLLQLRRMQARGPQSLARAGM